MRYEFNLSYDHFYYSFFYYTTYYATWLPSLYPFGYNSFINFYAWNPGSKFYSSLFSLYTLTSPVTSPVIRTGAPLQNRTIVLGEGLS